MIRLKDNSEPRNISNLDVIWVTQAETAIRSDQSQGSFGHSLLIMHNTSANRWINTNTAPLCRHTHARRPGRTHLVTDVGKEAQLHANAQIVFLILWGLSLVALCVYRNPTAVRPAACMKGNSPPFSVITKPPLCSSDADAVGTECWEVLLKTQLKFSPLVFLTAQRSQIIITCKSPLLQQHQQQQQHLRHVTNFHTSKLQDMQTWSD